ncbi:MAG: hypothetical protein IPJ32_13400 [Sphingobacteriaceae bacterium]|nr:hypothetical protein [Sphingobacteriaceae bacterium]
MKKSERALALEELILRKEEELILDGRLLKIHFHEAYESLKPLNLIKTTIQQVIKSPDLKENLANTVMGLASGFVAKKLIIGKTNNPLSNILGSIIELAVTNKVVNNAGDIKAIGSTILKKLLEKAKS